MNNFARRLWINLGRVLFWLTRPGIWLVIAVQPPRTRVVVIRGESILLVKDWLGSGRWKLPGGGLKRGEAAADGAVRELQEEVAIHAKTSQLVELGRHTVTSSGARVRIIVFSLHVPETSKAQIRGLEISAAQWLPLSELSSVQITESTRMALSAFQERTGLLK